MKFKPTIGLEVHCELRTKSKLFCGCPADHFGKEPNTQTCPVCLGLPGELPVTNKKAVDWTILLGLALNCKINKEPKFDRKHYFYPDLPMGFQISQYDEPFCLGGYIDTAEGRVNLTRVHLEIDTGKLQHSTIDGEKVSLVDFNRSGVALMEIVSEPELRTGTQAKEFAKNLQQIIRHLGISDCDMEKGSMRLEANVSLGLNLGYKVEVKNLNSFRFLEKAINYELVRQKKALESNVKLVQETRGWNESKQNTFPQRFKETAEDYRYFPDPDLPPMEFSTDYIESLRASLPKLPDQIAEELVKEYKIRRDYAQMISVDKDLLAWAREAFDEARKLAIDADSIASIVINQKVDISSRTPGEFVEMIKTEKEGRVNETVQLEVWVEKAMGENPKAIEDYRRGKLNAIVALVGAVMRISEGKADPVLTRKILEEKLK